MAGTGSIMYWNKPFSTDLRTGADFVHQSFFYLAGIVIVGHIVMALRDREALAGDDRRRRSPAHGRDGTRPAGWPSSRPEPTPVTHADDAGTAREPATLDA